MKDCKKKCKKQGKVYRGCIWVGDIFMIGGREWYGFTHCCCEGKQQRTKKENEAARDRFEKERERIRRHIMNALEWDKWPEGVRKLGGKKCKWPIHHVHPIKEGGDPLDKRNLIPMAPMIHTLMHQHYCCCYAGAPPWNKGTGGNEGGRKPAHLLPPIRLPGKILRRVLKPCDLKKFRKKNK